MSSMAGDTHLVGVLVSRAQRGERVATETLVQTHDGWLRAIIFGLCGRREFVDDLVQQVWMQALRRLPSLREPTQLKAWLYRIARHAVVDAGTTRTRLAIRETPVVDTGQLPPDQRQSPPPAQLQHRETRTAVLEAVAALPVHYREPFVLRHLENWSYAEIGEILGLPLATVETRLVRARRQLRETLREKV